MDGLWWRVSGKGRRVVVLVPGGPGCASDYLDPVGALLEHDARVVQFDPRGTGRTQLPGPHDLATGLADLEAVRGAANVETWTLVGHSAGANIALAYALDHPTATDGVVALGGGRGTTDDRQWQAEYERGRDAGLDPKPDTRFPVNLEANAEGNESWREYIKQPRLLRRLSELPVPLLAIHGSDDIRPGWPMQQLAELVPRGAFVELAGAGHMPWTIHPEHVRQLLLDFLQQGS